MLTQGVAVNTIDLLVSLDGKTSKRYRFAGAFDGTHLTQSADGMHVNLTFTRNPSGGGATASYTGTISEPGTSTAILDISGSTYNNPVAMSLHIGTYLNPNTGFTVEETGENNSLSYIDSNNTLQAVEDYAYNLNMYCFSFTQDAK